MTEYSNKVDELTQSLKDEKQARKSLETKLSSLEDEHKDLQSANAQFEKVIIVNTMSMHLSYQCLKRINTVSYYENIWKFFFNRNSKK